MNNSPINSTINSTTVVELADASSLRPIYLYVVNAVKTSFGILETNRRMKNLCKKMCHFRPLNFFFFKDLPLRSLTHMPLLYDFDTPQPCLARSFVNLRSTLEWHIQ